MERRITPWSIAITVAIAAAIVFSTCGVRHVAPYHMRGDGIWTTGLGVFGSGFIDILEWCIGLVDRIGRVQFHNPPIWIVLTSTAAVVVAVLSGSRRATASGGLIGLSTASILFGVLATIAAIGNDPREVQWSGAFAIWLVAVGALALTPWLRRFNLSLELDRWARRPQPPDESLPPMPDLSPDIRSLAMGARVVRASFDGIDGLDREARQLVWDFLQRVDGCPASDRALLGELGLHAEPLREILLSTKSDGVQPLLELDAALARFESELAAYRSHTYR